MAKYKQVFKHHYVLCPEMTFTQFRLCTAILHSLYRTNGRLIQAIYSAFFEMQRARLQDGIWEDKDK